MSLPLTADAVIFDCDGLLVETESGWTRAETKIFAEHGYGFGAAQKQILIGRTLAAAGESMAGYFGRPGEGPALARRLHDLVAVELAAGAAALPGAREILARVGDRVPIAVASNSPRPFVDAALASAGLADLVTRVFSAEDVEHAKPAPDLYLAACCELGADPGRSVAFEDSATGVRSARAAGLFVVGVPSLPGVRLEVDAEFFSLADPVLTGWALGPTPASGTTPGAYSPSPRQS